MTASKAKKLLAAAAMTLSVMLNASSAAPAAGESAGTRAVIRGGPGIERVAVIGEDGFYIKGGHAAKLDRLLDEKQVRYAAEKLAGVARDYLAGSKLYLAVVPDKNYYLAEGEGALFPRPDCGRMVQIMREALPGAVYIDLFGMLSLDDYYRTDSHWDQRSLPRVAQAIADAMGLGAGLMPGGGYTVREYSPFDGLYKRRFALPLRSDTLYWLTSETIDAATITGPAVDGAMPVYPEDKLTGSDPYNIFSGGPQSIITIESPLAKTERELIIFRDSFGSSIAPLLLEGYAKITLVDLRFMPAALLGKYIDFHGQDVLFLYSTMLLNSGMLLK